MGRRENVVSTNISFPDRRPTIHWICIIAIADKAILSQILCIDRLSLKGRILPLLTFLSQIADQQCIDFALLPLQTRLYWANYCVSGYIMLYINCLSLKFMLCLMKIQSSPPQYQLSTVKFFCMSNFHCCRVSLKFCSRENFLIYSTK